MKLHLPKLLLTALLAVTAQSFAATEITGDFNQSDYGNINYSDSELVLNSNISIPAWVLDEYYPSVTWSSETGGTLSGTGSISAPDGFEVEFGVSGWSTSGSYTIESGITLKNIWFDVTSANVVARNKFHNVGFDVYSGTLDLRQAQLSGYQSYELASGAILKRDTLQIDGMSSMLTVDKEMFAWNPYENPVLEGNLVLNGGGSRLGSGERLWTFDSYGSTNPFGPVVWFDKNASSESYGTLEITGTLTIQSETAVIFFNLCDNPTTNTEDYMAWSGTYAAPGDEALFICSGVNEEGLALLKPYVCREESWESYTDDEYGDYTEGGGIYTKSLDNYGFYAVTAGDGRVYIYIGEGGTGSGSPIPPNATVIAPGENVQLGTSAETTPSADKPVYLQGGQVDASTLDSSLLNNKVIMGVGGTVVTSGQQTMSLDGSGKVGYSVVGVNSAAGADLDIASSGNLTLSGEKYDTAAVAVKSGTVTISQGTTLGMGSGSTSATVDSGANVTNFGKVSADVELAGSSTLLNQGTVLGDIEALADSVVTNNGSIEGTLETAGKVYGSGTFAETNLLAGAFMHVGNSPGYQQHGTLTLERGTTLSFSVDGKVAATATSNGSGTYSVLKADTLTINPGSEAVNVTVEVTQGILAAGTEALTLKLMEVQNTNATEDDFSFTLEDNGWLEEGATLSWDSTTGSLTLAGEVSKAALAAMMSNAGTNVANTMWASASAVQEMVRTAENQFLVGMPGQTTFWGAGIGSFMNVSGSAGFTSNAGGYAVGLQHAFTEKFRAGIAFGQTFGSFESEDKQLKADQMSLIPALTAQYVTALDKVSSLTVSGHLSYGVVKNEADSSMMESTSKTEWDDTVLNIGVRAAWNRQLTANTTASVFAGLTYQQVEQDSFKEKQDGFVREYRDGSMSSLSLPIGVTLRGIYQMEGTNVFVPEVTVAYIGDIARENPEVKSTVMGIERTATGSKVGRSAITVSAGANWMFDSTWSVGAFYTMEARSKQFNQSVNAALRCSF